MGRQSIGRSTPLWTWWIRVPLGKWSSWEWTIWANELSRKSWIGYMNSPMIYDPPFRWKTAPGKCPKNRIQWLKEETMAVLFSSWIWNILRSDFFFGTCCALTTTPRLISLQVHHQFKCARVRLTSGKTSCNGKARGIKWGSQLQTHHRLIRHYPRLCSVIDVAADDNTTWCHASRLRTSPLCFECQELWSSGSGQGWWAECEEISQRLVLGGVSYLSEVYKNFLWLT